MVAVGTVLNVCGRDREALERAVEANRNGFSWEPAATNLEMVFIDLMRNARRN